MLWSLTIKLFATSELCYTTTITEISVLSDVLLGLGINRLRVNASTLHLENSLWRSLDELPVCKHFHIMSCYNSPSHCCVAGHSYSKSGPFLSTYWLIWSLSACKNLTSSSMWQLIKYLNRLLCCLGQYLAVLSHSELPCFCFQTLENVLFF